MELCICSFNRFLYIDRTHHRSVALFCLLYLFLKKLSGGLRANNQLILDNTVQTIETKVLQRAQQIYLDIALSKTIDVRWLTDSALQTHPSKVIELQDLLKSEVASSSDIVHAIHLYDPDRHVLLSSAYGLVLDARQGHGAAFLNQWTSGLPGMNRSGQWSATRSVPHDIFSSLPEGNSTPLITYWHSYPFQASGSTSDLIIAIDVKESAISRIISTMMPSQYESTFILDRSGSTISDADKSRLGLHSHYDASITAELKSRPCRGALAIHYIASPMSFRTERCPARDGGFIAPLRPIPFMKNRSSSKS